MTECEFCNRRFETEADYRKHFRIKTDGLHIVKECRKEGDWVPPDDWEAP